MLSLSGLKAYSRKVGFVVLLFLDFGDALQKEVVGRTVAVPIFVVVTQPLLNVVPFSRDEVRRHRRSSLEPITDVDEVPQAFESGRTHSELKPLSLSKPK